MTEVINLVSGRATVISKGVFMLAAFMLAAFMLAELPSCRNCIAATLTHGAVYSVVNDGKFTV